MNNILEVRNVKKHYPKFDLHEFSFDVPAGSIVGFIGRNGAGKSTTLKGIMNLLHFDGGEVFFEDLSMKEHELEIKQQIGFTMAELNYYPNKTVNQIVSVTSKFYKEFDMDKFNKLCDYFNIDKSKKLQELSSGMKVKYSLAVALSHNAKLLILDEPTSGLDPVSRDEILDIFSSLVKNKERSIIFSTHITSDLDKCADRILYIKEGQKIFEGTKEEFVGQYKVIKGLTLFFSPKLKDLSVSYKDNGSEFSALIKAEDISKIDTTNFEIVTPDLEEVMIIHEKEKNHEEFIF